MDLLATQVFEDNDFTPTQEISYPLHQDKTLGLQVGVLNVGSKTYPIKKGINKIGRHPECNIVLNDQTVSKKHAEIEASSYETSAWICDLNSSNKTKLNNSVLRPGRCYELKDGGVLEFGTVRAVFKFCKSLDDSLVPETPLPSRQKNQLLIPGTPDSSVDLSTSSTLGDNVSMIPGTQGNNQEPMFRRPSVPQRSSTSKKKSFINDSSVDDSTDNSRSLTVGDKENVGSQTTSIHDMETQKTFESLNETGDDIYDVETQKICLSNIKRPTKLPQNETSDIHDIETQHEDTEDNTFCTNETKMQRDVDIHDVKTPKRFDTRSATTWDTDDSVRNNLEESLIAEKKSPETVVPKTEVTEDTSSSESLNNDKTTEDQNDTIRTEYSKDLQKTSEEFLQLSLNTNFEEEGCSELDMSRNLLGSQNLLEHIMEANGLSVQTKSKVPTPEKSTNENDVEEKSTDDENIFDAVTQVKIHDDNVYKGVSQNVHDVFKVSQGADDSDETNQGVFQSYSYVRSKDNEKSSQDQSISDDSDTDEEGQFVKIALRERQNVSSPFEKQRNDDSEAKTNRSSSKESEDMFDMLTQHTNPANKKSLTKKNSDDDKGEVDFDAPTQVIIQEKLRTSEEPKDIDMMATQILPTTESPMKEVPSAFLTERKKAAIDEDITEMEDDVATQLITPPKEISNKSPSPTQLIEYPVEEYSVEDVDYETAPTQLISDIEEKKSNKKEASRKSKVPNKSSVNDSLERNLNAIFGDVTDDSLEDQQQISTQVLKNVLQSSEYEDEPENTNPTSNVDSDSSTKDKVKQSPRKTRRKSKAAVSDSSSTANSKTRLSSVKNVNTNSDSQNAENYFSVLTSRRKRNVLTDSQDLADPSEHKSDDEGKNEHTAESETVNTVEAKSSVCDNLRFKPERSSTPVTTGKKKYEEPKVLLEQITIPYEKPKIGPEEMAIPCEKPKVRSEEVTVPHEDSKVLPEEVAIPKDVEDSSNKATTEINDLMPSTSNDLRDKQGHSILDYDDEDVMFGLPEVRISGTLSNPPSPSLSTQTDHTESKKDSKTAASKRKGSTRKSTRKKTVSRKVTENIATYLSIGKSDPPNRLRSMSDVALAVIDVDALSTEISEKVNKNPKRSLRNATTGSSLTSKESESLDGKSTPIINIVQEQARQSPFVQSNGRTRSSSKKNVDRSSIFQVETEAPVENIEPAKSNVNTSRTGKRSLSTTDAVEDNAVKKPREDEENTLKTTRSRKSNAKNAKRYSANIMNLLTQHNSPINIKDPDKSKLPLDESNLINKQAIINIVRLSPYDSATSLSSNSPVEFVAKSVTKETRLTAPKATLGKPPSKVEPRQSRSRKAISKLTIAKEDVSPQGAESQEVEEIMSGLFIEEDINTGIDTRTNVNTNEDVDTNKKGAKTRSSRKRTRTNTPTDRDASASSISSDVCESNETHFEVPTLRSKRAKISKNISNAANATVNEETVAKTRNSRQSTKAKQAQPQIIPDSSSEEHLENSADLGRLDTTVNKTTKSGRRGQRTKAGKAAANKTEDKRVADNSVSSEINSSIDNASITSTPSRLSKSMSSAASPLRTKHKILFTGIPSSDYKKLLTKLGASLVEDPNKCTVLVTDTVRRTVKFLCALAQSIPIVSVDWLVECGKVGHFVELENYILKDPAAEAKFGFRLRGSLEKAKEHKLLEGYTILVTPNVKPPSPELKSIIVSCGGKALVKPPQSWPQKALIISCEEDLINAKKFLAKAPKTVTVQSTEFVLTGILKQELDFTKYKLI